jgi:hypothetical protein
MDQSKLKKLRQINYDIKGRCGMCKHGDFKSGTNWGVCKAHIYDHVKHTEATRQLSTYKYGHCPMFELDERIEQELKTWTEFLIL